MKHFFLLLLLYILGFINIHAQSVYSVKYDYQADIKVFVVDYDYQADLKVYKTNY